MAKNIAHTTDKVLKRWFNNKEAESYLGCKERFLRNLRLTGKLHFYKIGGHVLYDVNDLDKLVLKNKVV